MTQKNDHEVEPKLPDVVGLTSGFSLMSVTLSYCTFLARFCQKNKFL